MTETADCNTVAPLLRHPMPLSGVLEELPEAILIVDGDERVTLANGRVRDPYGIGPAEIVGRPLAELLTLPDFLLRVEERQCFLEAVLTALDAPAERHEHLFRCADGSTYLQRLVPAPPPGSGRLVITANVTGLRARNRSLETGAPDGLRPPPRPALRLIRGGRSA
ncbi:MAG: PAS domain-containing protein [Thermoleophilia bacterium]|nr:PAS domain-containing protein [Thermoleophilia bacterium]